MPTPTTWSHSSISTLLECGERYRLTKVAQAPSTPAWWFVSGNAFHLATETFDRDLFKGIERTEGEIVELWEQMFTAEALERQANSDVDPSQWLRGGRPSKAAPNKEDGEFLFEQGKIWVANYRTWRLEHPELVTLELPDGEPAIEVMFTVQIAGQLVRGAVDRVSVDTNTGIPLVIDLKTGRRPENDDQLAEYAIALRQLLDLDITYGAYYLAREGRLTEPLPLTLTLEEFEKTVRGVTVMRDNKVYIPQKSNRCKACDVNRFCASYGGADAALYEGIDS